jgi:Cu(I)/Ag(I) efflux system periplasmic protein CusF
MGHKILIRTPAQEKAVHVTVSLYPMGVPSRTHGKRPSRKGTSHALFLSHPEHRRRRRVGHRDVRCRLCRTTGQDMTRRGILMAIVATATSAVAVPALAWDGTLSTGHVLSAGRVVKIDIDAGTIMIEHKPITHLYMESMNMIFRVKDPAMLTALTPGDKIRFKVEHGNDGFIVTRIENSN